jgi:hypothetical protein
MPVRVLHRIHDRRERTPLWPGGRRPPEGVLSRCQKDVGAIKYFTRRGGFKVVRGTRRVGMKEGAEAKGPKYRYE